MPQDMGASVPDQALAVPVEPASGLAPSGFDPSRERPILDWSPLRVGANWQHCYIKLGDAEAMAAARYVAKPEWGHPLAAGCWVDEDSGALRLFCVDYEFGKRLTARHGARGKYTLAYGRTPRDEFNDLSAIATEAGTAATTEIDAVHEGAGPKGDAHD